MHTNKTTIISCIIAVVSNIALFCQAQKDTLLAKNIDWTVARVDKDTTLDCFYTSYISDKGRNGFMAYYLRNDSICKVVTLDSDSNGTRMNAYYYVNSAPILIIVKHNNFQLSGDSKQFYKTMLSFGNLASSQSGSGFITDLHTMYYVDQDSTFYSKTIGTGQERSKKEKGRDPVFLVPYSKYLLTTFNRKSEYFIHVRGG